MSNPEFPSTFITDPDDRERTGVLCPLLSAGMGHPVACQSNNCAWSLVTPDDESLCSVFRIMQGVYEVSGAVDAIAGMI